jgi:hypothetical protein
MGRPHVDEKVRPVRVSVRVASPLVWRALPSAGLELIRASAASLSAWLALPATRLPLLGAKLARLSVSFFVAGARLLVLRAFRGSIDARPRETRPSQA